MKHVLILTPWYPTLAHPATGTFVEVQAAALAEHYRVTVVHAVVSGPFGGGAAGKDGLESENRGGVTVHRATGRNRLPGIPMGFEYSVSATISRAVRQSGLEAQGVDVIHAHVLWPVGYAASRLARAWKVPLVVTEHQCPFATQLETLASRHCVQEAARHAHDLLAVSPSLQREMRAAGITRPIDVVPNAIDTRRFRAEQRRPGSTLRLLFVGELTERKGVTYLLDAVRMLCRDGDDVTLDLVGIGAESERYRLLAATLGISARCRFLGAVDPANLPAYYAECDIFVLPSLAETFGVVLLEAVSSGRPVVATRCGGPESFFMQFMGEMVEPGQPEALAEGIRSVFSRLDQFDPERMHREVDERFGRQAFVRRITEIYSGVC